MSWTFTVSIGGAAGQGIATTGDMFARIFASRGLHLNAYYAYQSIIRGGHTFLTIRTGAEPVTNFGDRIDLLIPLNQDAFDRHFHLMRECSAILYNEDIIKPGKSAPGVQLANHALHVVVTGGDGDGFGIGGNHFIHAMRRNVNLLYVAMDNQIYGLTTGQTLPTSQKGMKAKSMPFGNVEEAVNPIALAIGAGATFIARGFSVEPGHLVGLMKEGLEHRGGAFIGVFSPCVTYNHDNTYVWSRQRVRKLEDDPGFDPSNWLEALKRARLSGDEIPIGKFFLRRDVPVLDQVEPVLDRGGPLAHRALRIPEHVAREFVAEIM